MELRKDPITRSWVVIREGEPHRPAATPCPLCPGNESLTPPPLLTLPEGPAPWQVRVFPHFDPLFRIEGDPARAAHGIYDQMRPVGAHEIVVELRDHDRRLGQASDEEIARLLEVYARRITDLKQDRRFKYVSVFKNAGALAGQEIAHAYSQVSATPFVPRRMLHELRAARDFYQLKERCLFCDILRQEMRENARVVETTEHFVVFCPYAPRRPFEIWLLPRRHDGVFETGEHLAAHRLELARLFRHTLERIEQLSESYHLALHTGPNTAATQGRAGFWDSLEDDFHWHFEFLPLVTQSPPPYIAREIYFTSVAPESAAARLRAFSVRD